MKWFFTVVFSLMAGGNLFPQDAVTGHARSDSISTHLKVPELIFVAGGRYRMGLGSLVEDARPVHWVSLDNFYIGKFEVTQEEYASVMGAGGAENYFSGCDSCPVERVSWFNAGEYLQRLSQLTGSKFRLPTEAEWEFAARGGTASKGYKYSGSNNAQAVGWIVGASETKTHGVGQKKPNELGIYDMTGNVFEWCSDYYDPLYYSVSPPENPGGPETGTYRVMRGGSWFHDSSGLKNTDRGKGNPGCRYGFVGFRVCRSAN
jgi:sulfatase modifying factor 1